VVVGGVEVGKFVDVLLVQILCVFIDNKEILELNKNNLY
jgi:hypothetical protein